MLIPFLICIITKKKRNRNDLILIQIDFCGIVTALATKYRSFVLCRFQRKFNADSNEITIGVSPFHFILPTPKHQKDVDFSGQCLRMFLEGLLSNNRNLRKLVVFSDGGKADFHNSKFLNLLSLLQEELAITIEFVVLAPYHGWGACDSAHSQCLRKLKHWILEDREHIISDSNQIETIFNTVANHSSMTVEPDEKFPEVPTYTGISQCFYFKFPKHSGTIDGYYSCIDKQIRFEWQSETFGSRKKK